MYRNFPVVQLGGFALHNAWQSIVVALPLLDWNTCVAVMNCTGLWERMILSVNAVHYGNWVTHVQCIAAYLYRHAHMLELKVVHCISLPQLKDYVKHNKVEGWVEIELFNERGKNWAVRRLLNADTNSSSWMLDGKEVLKKKVSIFTTYVHVFVCAPTPHPYSIYFTPLSHTYPRALLLISLHLW